jgi:hypothetical protein
MIFPLAGIDPKSCACRKMTLHVSKCSVKKNHAPATRAIASPLFVSMVVHTIGTNEPAPAPTHGGQPALANYLVARFTIVSHLSAYSTTRWPLPTTSVLRAPIIIIITKAGTLFLLTLPELVFFGIDP